MKLSKLFSILATIFCFTASITFIISTLFSGAEEIAALSFTKFGYNPSLVRSLSANTACMFAGSLQLVIAFTMQILSFWFGNEKRDRILSSKTIWILSVSGLLILAISSVSAFFKYDRLEKKSMDIINSKLNKKRGIK